MGQTGDSIVNQVVDPAGTTPGDVKLQPVSGQDRRSANRTRDDADWESKVLGRLNGRLHALPADSKPDDPTLGWEATVLDVLRKRIERESK